MSDPLTFSIECSPVPKGRPRATVRGGYAKMYTPPATRAYEAGITRIAAAAMRGRQPLQGPLSVSMRFRLAIPKSTTKRAREALLAGEEAYLGRADLTNYAKAVEDALNGICWRDDVQIVRLFLTKAASTTPGVDVRIEPLGSE